MSDDDDQVGYGRPPRQHRFKKGMSGNRKGRPKGARNLATIVCEVLTSPVDATVNGKACRMSVLEATAHKTKVDALRGNKAAADRIFEWAKYLPQNEPLSDGATTAQPVEDLALLSTREINMLIIIKLTATGDEARLATSRREYVERYGEHAAFWLNREE